MTEFTFKLASKPDVPNKNGIVYSQETFDKMFNSEYTQESLKSHNLVISNIGVAKTADNYYRFVGTALDYMGPVKEWNGSEVKADIVDRYSDIIKELQDQDRLELGMNYTCRLEKHRDGTIEAIAMKIHSFSLIDKQTGRFL